ncbi:MAG TPA: NAD(P)H-dependent oxidoreductase [Candidatus Methylacidiphilales bacterium]|nr:NAD(P)H-dependent oxidoreductase [Candidatus Methylacidiphilales bacterium]
MITILIGTNRPESNTEKVAAHVVEIYTAKGHAPKVMDLHRLPPEIFHPSSYAQKPASFAPFQEAILNASGVVIVTPEYNGGIPGVFKYFVDMLKFPESFTGMPVAFVGLAAGIWGALRPVEQIEDILIYRRAMIFPERVHISGINGHLDEKGRLKSAELVERLEKQADGFIQFVKRARG